MVTCRPAASSCGRPMLDRLAGTETEYAISFEPAPGVDRPGNDRIFEAVASAVRELVHTRPGQGLSSLARSRFFTENGGSLYYEHLPYAHAGGLIEAATPECRGPDTVLLYQRAQEELLGSALPRAQQLLAIDGHHGRLALRKNCRDAAGHVYGSQENYEVQIADGAGLWAFRIGAAAIVPLVVALGSVLWALLFAIVITAIAGLTAGAIVDRLLAGFGSSIRVLAGRERGALRWFGTLQVVAELVFLGIPIALFAALLRAVAFRRERRGLLAFLASRPIVTGAGTLERDERFGLSEKASAIRRTIRWSTRPNDRGVFEVGHLMKALISPITLEFRDFRRLFGRRQRLQLGFSDANLCPIAERLKLGLTTLVIDMAEDGALDDAPRLRSPVRALHAIAADPTLRTTVRLADGREATALELQRDYCDRARAWIAAHPTPSLEAQTLVDQWASVLDGLASDPASLFGMIDWVTKRTMLEQAGSGERHAVRKKIDLRYHELGTGYLAQAAARGLVPDVLDAEAVERAIREPPSGSPAQLRGRLVRELSARATPSGIAWHSVRIGDGLRGKVVSLEAWKRRRDASDESDKSDETDETDETDPPE